MRLRILYRILYGTFYALALFVLESCLSPIDVRTDDGAGRLIISGQVSTVSHRNVVYVSRTANTERKPFDVPGALVWIVDEQGVKTKCDESKPGVYKPGESFLPTIGSTYHVEINVEGRSYESKPESIPAIVGDDNVSYDFVQKDYTDVLGKTARTWFVDLNVSVKLPGGQPYYLKWEVSEAWMLIPTDFPDPFGGIPPNCFVTRTADPQRVPLIDGRNGKAVETNLLVASRLADHNSFHTAHAFFIFQSSMTPEAYEYWRKVRVLVNQVGSIFDTPPADINGNISSTSNPDETVYGYFQANNETYHKIKLYSSDMPFLPLPYCEYDMSKPETEYLPECLRCLDYPGSSHEEPPLFNR